MPERGSLIDEMMQFLHRTRPGSSANALAELRQAFPHISLCERVRACRNWPVEAAQATHQQRPC